MSDNTKIEWADATANYCNGCSVLSAGCTNCYAMRAGGRNLPGHPSTGLTKPSKAGHEAMVRHMLPDVADPSLALAKATAKNEALTVLARQYRSDLLYPPTADSRERRLAAINDTIGEAK